MAAYMDGYRDGSRLARLENAEDVYESQCDALERQMSRLAAMIQRRHPSQCKKEMREYIVKSQYFAGFCAGFTHARRGDSARD
jgi:hypothetical protein